MSETSSSTTIISSSTSSTSGSSTSTSTTNVTVNRNVVVNRRTYFSPRETEMSKAKYEMCDQTTTVDYELTQKTFVPVNDGGDDSEPTSEEQYQEQNP